MNYFFYTPEVFGDKVIHDEMLEATSFNDWFYGTSYDSVRSDCINIGVFNPTGIEFLLARKDVELKIFYINVKPKIRMLRQLNREKDPDVDEIVRRYKADKDDFEYLEDFDYIEIPNETFDEMRAGLDKILSVAQTWSGEEGKNR